MESSPRLPRRPLGRTGLQVSPLGLARVFGPWVWTEAPRAYLAAEEVERAFHDFGVNTFLVSSRMQELCEGVRRLIRAGHRDELVLVSGQGLPWAAPSRRGLEQHLRVLGTDRLDVWIVGFVHRPWSLREGAWSEMRRLREQGKTRAIGFSSHDRGLAARLARELDPDVLMIRYNASHRGAEREVFEPLAELGPRRPGVIAYTATRWGMLLKPLPSRGFQRPMSGPECYRFALGHPVVDSVWCAARSPDELAEDVAGALLGPLEAERRAEACRFGDAVHDSARFGWRFMFGKRSA
jgi:aryl-alcohol dehydrogenase-like predicted oxidoreductase